MIRVVTWESMMVQKALAPVMALDGIADPYYGWISKQYGGGTEAKPLDVWWAVEFPKPLPAIAGVRIFGDHRAVIPVQTALQVQVRENGAWKTVVEVKDAKDKDLTVKFPQVRTVSALRIFVPAANLPKFPQRTYTDGYVRICELKVLLPDGSEANPLDLCGKLQP